MLQYNVKFIKFAIDGKDVFYDIQINDLISLNSNLVCIKYTTLYKLHKKLKEENPYSEFPQFPKQDKIKKILKLYDNEASRLAKLEEYFKTLIKKPPPLFNTLSSFLKDCQDDKLISKLLSYHLYFTSKKEFQKIFKKVKVLKKGEISKSYLIQKDQNFFIMRKFILPPIKESRQACANYFQCSQKIAQIPNIIKVKHMLELKPQNGFMSSFWPQDNVQQSDNNPYSFLNLNKPNQSFYTIEEYYGQSLDVILTKKKDYFPFEEVVSILQQIGNAILALHQKGITHKNLNLKNIMYGNEIKISEINLPYLQQNLITEQKQDAILLGRVMLAICTLQKKGQEQELLQQVESVYGTELRRIITQLLEGLLIMSELISPKLMPFKADVFKIKKKQKEFRRIEFLSLDIIEELKKDMDEYKETEFDISINLQGQEIDEKQFKYGMHQLGHEPKIVRLQLNLAYIKINTQELCEGLLQLKTIKVLHLDLKGIELDSQLILDNDWVTIDIRGGNDANVVIKKGKIYKDEQVHF